MNLIDFLIGALLMNAMPHFIFGMTKTKYLGLFGFSPAGNIAYALLQFAICLVLFHFTYGISTLPEHGMLVGGMVVLVLFFAFGKILYNVFNRNNP